MRLAEQLGEARRKYAILEGMVRRVAQGVSDFIDYSNGSFAELGKAIYTANITLAAVVEHFDCDASVKAIVTRMEAENEAKRKAEQDKRDADMDALKQQQKEPANGDNRDTPSESN